MVRARRYRWVELELLLFPALLIAGGLLLLVLVDRGNLNWEPSDLSTSGAFVLALLLVHTYLNLTRFRGDQVLFPLVAMLTAVGLVMIQRLADFGNRAEFEDLYKYLRGIDVRQTMWVFIGIAALLFTVAKFDWTLRLRRYKYTIALLGLLLMAGLLVPGLGIERGGAKLWYDLGPILFQPSEIVKVVLVFFFAAYLDERRDLLASEYRVGPLKLPPLPYLAPMVVMWGVSMMVIVVMRDLGGALLFFGIFLSMLYVVTGRALYVWVLGGLFMGGAFFAYQTFGHVQTRVETWLYPFEDVLGGGYQITQSLFALATGGIYGSGLGSGQPNYMRAVNTDMIFSAIGEELGMIGALAVLALYLVLVFRGFYISMHARNGFYQLMGIGLTTIFGLQTIIIIMGDVKLIPLTGITLPFVAYGGSSIVINFLMAGLLLGISGSRGGAEEL